MAMEVEHTDRGFETIERPLATGGEAVRLVQQSSAIGDYDDAMDKPGSSKLWIGHHHLSREEVAELIGHLQRWVATGSLQL